MNNNYLNLNIQLFGAEDETPPAPTPTPEKTFNQEAVDKIVEARLVRERTTAAKKLTDLGIDGTFDKDSYQTYLKHQEGQKTELEKLQGQMKQFETSTSKSQIEVTELKLKLELSKAGIVGEHVEAAGLLLNASLQKDDKLEPTKAIKALIKMYPMFVDSTTNDFGVQRSNNAHKQQDGGYLAAYKRLKK